MTDNNEPCRSIVWSVNKSIRTTLAGLCAALAMAACTAAHAQLTLQLNTANQTFALFGSASGTPLNYINTGSVIWGLTGMGPLGGYSVDFNNGQAFCISAGTQADSVALTLRLKRSLTVAMERSTWIWPWVRRAQGWQLPATEFSKVITGWALPSPSLKHSSARACRLSPGLISGMWPCPPFLSRVRWRWSGWAWPD